MDSKIHFIPRLIFLFLLPVISERISAYALRGQKLSSQFEFIKNFQGLKKGDEVEGMKDLKVHLERFGYLNPPNLSHDDRFDGILESAIKTYQLNFNLNTTGILDPQTVSTMMMPRCGVPDIINGTTRMRSGSFHAHYEFFPAQNRWPKGKQVLNYEFGPGTREDVKEPFRRAASAWQHHIPFKFEHFNTFEKADVKVSFERRDHGDGNPFEGPGGALAHASGPTYGILHFDAEENWVVGAVPGGFDMQTTSLHELGHILGLAHSSDENAIMWPGQRVGTTKDLNDDDIKGIKALYAGY